MEDLEDIKSPATPATDLPADPRLQFESAQPAPFPSSSAQSPELTSTVSFPIPNVSETESSAALTSEDSTLEPLAAPVSPQNAAFHSTPDSPGELPESTGSISETVSPSLFPPASPPIPPVYPSRSPPPTTPAPSEPIPIPRAAPGASVDEYGSLPRSLSRKSPKSRAGPVSGEDSLLTRNVGRVIRTPTAESQPRVLRSRPSKRRPYLRITGGYAPLFLGVFLLWSSYALHYKYRGLHSTLEAEMRTMVRKGAEKREHLWVAEVEVEAGAGVGRRAGMREEGRRDEVEGGVEGGGGLVGAVEEEWAGTEEEVAAQKAAESSWAATLNGGGVGSSFARMKERSAATAIAKRRGGEAAEDDEGEEEEEGVGRGEGGEEETDGEGGGGSQQVQQQGGHRRAAPKHLTLPPRRTTPTGVWVGPFDALEEEVLGGYRESRGKPTRLGGWEGVPLLTKGGLCGPGIRNRHFVVVMHEASLTGAPLAMAELAGHLLHCGARVLVTVLNKKGPLLKRMAARGFPLAKGKGEAAYPAAEAAHAVIVGSAACWQWVELYCDTYPHRANRVVWWVMENRKEYFDVAKAVMPRVGPLLFIAQSQADLWKEWSLKEGLPPPNATVVHLSLNGYLSVATAGASEREREALRAAVRESMGLHPSDFLFVMLSTVNGGKGQVYVVEAMGQMLTERNGGGGGGGGEEEEGGVLRRAEGVHSRRRRAGSGDRLERRGGSSGGLARGEGRGQPRHLLESLGGGVHLLLGSMGSKANKEEYVARVEGMIQGHPHLPSSVLWAQETTRVAALYAAADAYVMNAQGIGETFGRVTVEAMAFGLPVLASEGGGTPEVVLPNVTALMHPVGSHGVRVMHAHMRRLVENRRLGATLGEKGKQRVKEEFCEGPMYDKLGEVLRPVVEMWEDEPHMSANSARWREYLKELIDVGVGKKKRRVGGNQG